MGTASSEVKMAALVAISDSLFPTMSEKVKELESVLASFSIECIKSAWLYEESTPAHKAAELNGFFGLSDVAYIFDLSGGNLANTVLDYLDYDIIRDSKAVFFGYSDLSCVINSIYTTCKKNSILYQVRNLLGNDGAWQRIRFADFVLTGGNNIFEFPYEFVRGDVMDGHLVGGNIRCTLKLAGTKYFPPLKGNIILLESLGGSLYATMSQFAQLVSMDDFSEVSGILLGTFTAIQKKNEMERLVQFILDQVPEHIAIAKTEAIGHGEDSSAAYIGRRIRLEK